MSATYQLDQQTFGAEDPRIGGILAQAHATKKRPACLCKRPPVPMYVAKMNGRFFLKRMPDTGPIHSPTCESYEPPAELSGLGEVSGAAIQENLDDGTVALRLDFALTKTGSRAAPVTSGEEADTARTDGKKLTLRGMLHYLWDQAGFTRWTPAMLNKRSWSTIRKYVSQAALDKQAKGASLADALFMPEPFVADQKADIARRRAAKLAPLAQSAKGARKLMVLIGEVKAIDAGRYDFKLTVKHLPDYPFLINADLHKRLFKRFQRELGLWEMDQDGHLVVVATFGLSPSGYATVEEAALMFVDRNWIPYESFQERELLTQLIDQRRSFTKGLRYNLPANRPLAFAVLHDTKPQPVALYVLPAEASSDYAAAMTDLISGSALSNWFWRPPEGLPALPSSEGFSSMPLPDLASGNVQSPVEADFDNGHEE